MASLKDTIINGALRVIGTLFAGKIQTNTFSLPITDGGTTYGTGSTGQVLKKGANSVYWAMDNNTTYSVGTTTVPNVTSVGSAPTLGTAISADDITKFEVNSSNACLEIAYTSRSIPNVTSAGSTPTLGTAITVVNSVTAN